jgi:hypothetical protein
VPEELLALLEIALYVEPRSAVLEKLRGAINYSHSIMKHIIGGMDKTKEFIFKAFMCFRCTFKAFGVTSLHFKVVQINRGSFFKKNYLGGTNYHAPWRNFRARARWCPLNQKAWCLHSSKLNFEIKLTVQLCLANPVHGTGKPLVGL